MEGPGGFGGVGLGRDGKGPVGGSCDQASAPAGLALQQRSGSITHDQDVSAPL